MIFKAQVQRTGRIDGSFFLAKNPLLLHPISIEKISAHRHGHPRIMNNSTRTHGSRLLTPAWLLRPILLLSLLSVGSTGLLGCGGEAAEEREGPPPDPLLQPANFTETAPETFVARLETSKGVVRIQVTREWAPLGADRFYNLVKAGYYDGVTFHRVIPGFMAEFGINGDPWVNAAWRQATMRDEPVRERNTRGRVSFSKSEPHTRTVQVFINTDDNPNLNGQGFSPFGEVIEGMEVVDALFADYGESPTRGGEGVYQAMAIARGDEYLDAEFPLLDRIERAVIEAPGSENPGG
jgi:peptidyl-prolyl cis-trans isomerase A (cyclophilin A)